MGRALSTAKANEAAENDLARTLATVLKPQKPTPYEGAINAVAALNFVDSLEEYYTIVTLTPSKWVRYAVLSLNGEAKAWWRDSGLNLDTPWADFRKAFLRQFTPPDSANAARRALDKLRQGRMSVAEYTSKFRSHLRLATNLDKDSALQKYMLGLEPETSKQ
ncbi:hypothetical protein BX616_007833, partial [Lobosporangium transversale]